MWKYGKLKQGNLIFSESIFHENIPQHVSETYLSCAQSEAPWMGHIGSFAPGAAPPSLSDVLNHTVTGYSMTKGI